MPFTEANTTKASSEGAGVVALPGENEACRRLPAEPCGRIEDFGRDMLGLGLIWDEPQPDRDRKRQNQDPLVTHG